MPNLARIYREKSLVSQKQLFSLKQLLTKNLRKSDKKKLEKIIDFKFYSILEIQTIPWERFKTDGDIVIFEAQSEIYQNAELKKIREILLNNFENFFKDN